MDQHCKLLIIYSFQQQGAELEARDKKGWTALFHATYSGHQNMVKFLLVNNANMEARFFVEYVTFFIILFFLYIEIGLCWLFFG